MVPSKTSVRILEWSETRTVCTIQVDAVLGIDNENQIHMAEYIYHLYRTQRKPIVRWPSLLASPFNQPAPHRYRCQSSIPHPRLRPISLLELIGLRERVRRRPIRLIRGRRHQIWYNLSGSPSVDGWGRTRVWRSLWMLIFSRRVNRRWTGSDVSVTASGR